MCKEEVSLFCIQISQLSKYLVMHFRLYFQISRLSSRHPCPLYLVFPSQKPSANTSLTKWITFYFQFNRYYTFPAGLICIVYVCVLLVLAYCENANESTKRRICSLFAFRLIYLLSLQRSRGFVCKCCGLKVLYGPEGAIIVVRICRKVDR